jgi:uncharacterized membrane protein HdeD (DUF308 family)
MSELSHPGQPSPVATLRNWSFGVGALLAVLGGVSLAWPILFEAAAKLMAAFSVPRDYPWGWILVDGLVTAVLGAILFTATPERAPVYLAVIIGINLLSSGLVLLGTGFWLNRATG